MKGRAHLESYICKSSEALDLSYLTKPMNGVRV